MHLRERRGGNWDGVDEREQGVHVFPEFLFQARTDFIEWPSGDAVLQLLQLGAKFRRKKVRQNADQLADFDEQAAQLENRAGQPARAPLVSLDEVRVIEARAE